MEVKRICKWCGKPFIAQKTTTNYCSHLYPAWFPDSEQHNRTLQRKLPQGGA